ncbi:uncharacterized protein NEPG_01626 [Nematocida parisii ERTm1]|uniref:Uncharacterized protein n=1 Tax=Nematocida parisii (strain ERTm3) TaxID=935791 RepID=I3EIW9_NEMP3|nr:uncharacterized protein NEPG_01626 [Nematocida parisii ERTm1]EIJ89166.1 hypothetical protein NEQG_00985 [Nematocida parisii ERTm3]EIJ93284.1 hypothetical protein NEPG_01626 [Nematocida parisii ERTm1]|eukprot:XP_013059454.1 hypothetical protein NEPG_01626 [Nematocida parisii ERTm1]
MWRTSVSIHIFIILLPCMNREGGKKKPLKAAKKSTKELDEHDLEFQEREREKKRLEKEMKDAILKGKKKK